MRTVDAAGLRIGESEPPRIMGVVNVSENSPYDPSVHLEADQAAAHIDELIDAGADIVDVGLATANKRFDPLDADAERERLTVAADAIASASKSAIFSIETRYASVAATALDRGFDMVNDVCGFADKRMPEVCADHDVAVVKMASPPDLRRPGALDTVDAIHRGLQRGGFTQKTIVDPAFGGWSETKTLAVDRETFHRLAEFRAYGRPILVSINRKNFLRDLVDRDTDDALPVSLGATALAVERGVSIVRTHDVAATRDATLVGAALGRDRVVRSRTGGITELDTLPTGALRVQLDERAIDPARADDWSWRVFSLTGIDRGDTPWIRERLESAGVVALGDDPLVVAGSTRAIRRLHRVREDMPSPADDLVATMLEAV